METKKLQKGVALYIALVISMFVLSLALGMSVIVFSQMKMMGEIGHSVVAFYAADTGIEKALYMKWKEDIGNWATTESVSIGGGASYNVSYNSPIWKSVGAYSNTRRAVEITEEIFDFKLSFIDPCYECYHIVPPHSPLDCDYNYHPVLKVGTNVVTMPKVYAEITGGSTSLNVDFKANPEPGLNVAVVFQPDSCFFSLDCSSEIYIFYNQDASPNGEYYIDICGEVGTTSRCAHLDVTVDNFNFCPG